MEIKPEIDSVFEVYKPLIITETKAVQFRDVFIHGEREHVKLVHCDIGNYHR